uniref:Exocyst complex component 2 n=1 Tax=Hirondellea gigas TaxID=1518452 RepID=A0A6A7G522_9CRUS
MSSKSVARRCRKEIEKLVLNLNQKASLKKAQHKDHIRQFAEYYKDNHPDLLPLDAVFLFQGNDQYPKGLLHHCGSTHLLQHSELKESALMAAQLISILVDPARNVDFRVFRNSLKLCKMDAFKEMKLGMHLLREKGSGELFAFVIVAAVQDSFVDVPLEAYVEEENARDLFYEYQKIDQDQESEESADTHEVGSLPEAWSQVTPADFEFDEEAPDEFSSPNSPVSDDDSFAVASDPLDPLGILNGPAAKERIVSWQRKNRKKTWASSRARSSRKSPESQLLQDEDIGATQKFVRTSEDSFRPHLFLTALHSETTCKSLEDGLSRLRESVSDRTEQMRLLVRDHFDQFVTCKDTIDVVYQLSRDEPKMRQGQFQPNRLQEVIDELQSMYSSLYGNILERKHETDQIKDTLSVLKRFQFLFRMPGEMKRNIETKQFEKVVRDYRRAKSFVVKDDQQILKKVLKKIFDIVHDFRSQAMKKLEDPRASYDEQEKIIGYLVALDCEDDPMWYYVNRQHEWTLAQLDRCNEDHQQELARCRDDHQQRVIAMNLRDRSSRPDSEIFAGSTKSVIDHSKKKLVKHLSAVLTRDLPNFYRFSQEISTGKFVVSDASGAQSEPKVLVDHIKKLITEIQTTYSTSIRQAIIPVSMSEDSSSGSSQIVDSAEGKSPVDPNPVPPSSSQEFGKVPLFMLDNVKCILRCYGVLKKLKMPKGQLDVLRSLAEDATRYYFTQIWKKCLWQLSSLHLKEKWIQPQEYIGITTLPIIFRDIVEKAFSTIEEIPVFVIKGPWILELIGAPLLECMRNFADALHELAFNPNMRVKAPSESTPSQDQCLLFILNNCSYARSDILPALQRRATKLIPKTYQYAFFAGHDKVNRLMVTLDGMVFEYYVRKKALFLNSLTRDSFMMDGINWQDSPEPEDVRPQCHNFLLELVHVHRELYVTARKELDEILQKLVEKTLDNYHSYVKQIGRFSPNGALQIMIELEYMEWTLKHHVSRDARSCIRDIQEILSNWVDRAGPLGGDKRKQIIQKTWKANKLMFLCFEK